MNPPVSNDHTKKQNAGESDGAIGCELGGGNSTLANAMGCELGNGCAKSANVDSQAQRVNQICRVIVSICESVQAGWLGWGAACSGERGSLQEATRVRMVCSSAQKHESVFVPLLARPLDGVAYRAFSVSRQVARWLRQLRGSAVSDPPVPRSFISGCAAANSRMIWASSSGAMSFIFTANVETAPALATCSATMVRISRPIVSELIRPNSAIRC